MLYSYHSCAGEKALIIEGELFTHLFKSRRTRHSESLPFRNLCDEKIYHYAIKEISKKSAILSLLNEEYSSCAPAKHTHLGWCLIDAAKIEKTLPFLNELGLSELTFLYSDRVQRENRIDFKRLERILISSSEQCGRSQLMKLNSCVDTLESFLSTYPEAVTFDPKGDKGAFLQPICTYVIGPEGGFSPSELTLFSRCYQLDTPLILRSETATTAILSKIIL